MKRKLGDYKKWRAKALKDPETRRAYEEADSDPFIEVATQLIRMRKAKHLTQAQLARKLHTSQQAVARLESLKYKGYTVQTLETIAETFNKELKILFV